MAINEDNSDNGIFETKPKAAPQPSSDGFGAGIGHIDLGVGNTAGSDLGNGFFYNLEGGSEYLTSFFEGIPDDLNMVVKKRTVEFATKLHRLDRTTSDFSNLDYSIILVVSRQKGSQKVYVNNIMLEGTGDDPKQVSHIVDAINSRDSRSNTANMSMYVASDSFDDKLLTQAMDVITALYNVTVEDIILTNGFVVPYDQSPKEIAKRAVIHSMNTNLARFLNDENIVGIIDIPAYINKTKDSTLQLDITQVSGASTNVLGRPVRSDFSLTLNQRSGRGGSVHLNNRTKNVPLVTTSGYIEYIPKTVHNPMTNMPENKIMPAIILTDTISRKQTLDMILMGIVSSTIFGNPQQLASMLLHNGTEIGVLNYITNLEGNKSGIGDAIALKTGKLTKEQVMSTLTRMFDKSPVIHIETELFGVNYDSSGIFASIYEAGTTRIANDGIIATAEAMTKTKMRCRDVYLDTGILIPMGTWIPSDGGGPRDIREIDLAFVLGHTNDKVLIHKWISSNLPTSGVDPYIAKLEVINALVPTAVITGKAVRFPLNSEFLAEFATKMMSLGFDPSNDSDTSVAFTNYNDLSALAATYANAGLDNIQFGHSSYGGGVAGPSAHINMYGRHMH